MDAFEQVILVDRNDVEIGTEEKLAAHRDGVLHRAFSVMVWDRSGRLLLQRRHIGKYHSGGLWTNTCCGHPRPGEDTKAAAKRRLAEEMGFSCELEELGSMIYRAALDLSMTEHELVHIFRGQYDGAIHPAPDECDGYSWEQPHSIRDAPETRYTAWFNTYLTANWPIEPPR